MLAVNLSKAEFPVDGTIYLGYMLKGRQVQMDPAKLQTMSKWPVPTKKNEVQVFLDLPNYYRVCDVNDSANALASPQPYEAYTT